MTEPATPVQTSDHSAAKVEAALHTQKPVTQGCGRVFGETIHFDKNTMSDRTSQPALEFTFPQLAARLLPASRRHQRGRAENDPNPAGSACRSRLRCRVWRTAGCFEPRLRWISPTRCVPRRAAEGDARFKRQGRSAAGLHRCRGAERRGGSQVGAN
jgi:hypothetical protein